jgi:hypothetical protein
MAWLLVRTLITPIFSTFISQNQLNMKEWFKPLFSYKKYITAERILRECCNSHATLKSEPHEPPLLTENIYPNVWIAATFLTVKKPIDKTRLIEAINLLEKNNHISSDRSTNLYRFTIKCTIDGESAFNDGFYRKLALIEVRQVAVIIFSIISVIALIIFRKSIIELLQNLFHS